MFKKILFLFTCSLSLLSFSQIIGNVKSSTNETLAFVNIYIEDTYKGTTSNEDGNYELNVTETGNYTVVFKFLGFKTEKKDITITSFPYELNATLQEENVSLNEVVINSNENPANRIIRAAIDNRKLMLEKIDEFNADFYSRGLIKIEDVPEKIFGQDVGDLEGSLDSTRSGIIYLSETISKIDFKRPDNLKEKIVASKVSGNDNGFSFNTAMDVDFNFYNNTIELGNQIVSPIADYAFNYYRYKLDGVFYDDKGNLINKIKVIPKRENDRIFSGTIYIVEDQWSIYALELDITGQQAQIPVADNISLTQTFSYSDTETFWVLISQQIDFAYGIFGITGEGRFSAVYSNYNFQPNFDKKSFGKEILSFENEANKKDSSYWSTIRPIPLTKEETDDYVVKDSIQIVRKSKTYLDSIDAKSNRFKITDIISGYDYQNSYKKKYFSISGPSTGLSFNTVQGYNNLMRINFRKNYDEFRKYVSVGANVGYGLSDKQLRGTLYASYKFNDINDQIISVSGGVTTQQFNTNAISPLINSVSTLFFEDNYIKLFETSYAQLNFSREVFNGLNMYSSLSYQRRQPLYNTTDYVTINEDNDAYTSNNPLDETAFGVAPFSTHNIAKLNVSARIRFGQKYFSYPDSKFAVTNDDYPSLFLSYEKGFAASNDNYNYDQLQLRLTQGFNVGNKGRFRYNIKAGKLFNADDIAFMDYQHFNGNQTRVGTSSSYLNVFNNLPYYTLSTNNQYLEMHAEHDFRGFILGKIPLLNKLNYNLVIGAHSLATPDNNPYQEFSIGIDNIGFKKFRFLRLDYVRSYQNGFKSDAVIFGLKFLNFID
ncbi:MAG: hypothetical protein DA407_06095 [Bacteroidetes bacterium]|nr:MAG: hypothetical protein DA407_06095 [Bacteroidota bacterium]